MAAVDPKGAVRLVGPPQKLTGTLDTGDLESRIATISLRLQNGPQIHRARIRGIGAGQSEVRLRLPRSTQPGTYSGDARFGDLERSVVVEVEGRERLRLLPRRTALSVPPGGTADFEITVINNGNLPIHIPESESLDLDDVRGPDRALGRALRADLNEDESRVERLFDELEADHGGEARIVVTSGAGSLEPGSTRELRCRLEVPKSVDDTRVYAGAWGIGDVGHEIVVQVTQAGANGARRKIR